jgi:hypothetical protein
MSRRALRTIPGLLGALLLACRAPSPAATSAATPAASADAATSADSLVLERTACYGICPAYRLSLDRAGAVRFASRNTDDATQARDQVAPATLGALVARARRTGFFALPARLRGDATLCPDYATDHPTVRLAIFGPGLTHQVEDYHGCFARADHSVVPPVAALRALELAVDSATGSARWVRPNRR